MAEAALAAAEEEVRRVAAAEAVAEATAEAARVKVVVEGNKTLNTERQLPGNLFLPVVVNRSQ